MGHGSSGKDPTSRRRASAIDPGPGSRERLLLAAMQTSPDAFVVIDHEDRVEWWNRAAERLFGWMADEAAGRLLTDLVVPEQYRDAHHEGLRRRAAGGRPRLGAAPVQVEAVCRDGRRIIVELSVGELDWEGGRRFHAFIRDVTDRESARSALELSEARARMAFLHAPVGMLLTEVVDGEFGRVMSANPVAEEMLGHTEDALRLLSPSDITHPDDLALDQSLVPRLVRGEVERLQYEKRFLKPDGREVWVTFSATVVRDVDGAAVHSIHQFLDISQRLTAERAQVRLNAELQQANEELAAANTELDRFAAVVAHDLKNPLTAILMHAELLLESQGAHLTSHTPSHTGSDGGRRGAQAISSAARRLNSFIEGLLVHSRAQGAPLHRTRVDLGAMVDDVVDELAATPGRPVRFTRDDLPSLYLESVLFRQVIANVLDNGRKYVAPDVEPHVHVSAEHDESTQSWTLHVADNGIGIAPAARERVFEAFHREAPEYPGTGIGLATCRRIIERHGGRIWISSRDGGGTVVSVRLPTGRRGGSSEPLGEELATPQVPRPSPPS